MSASLSLLSSLILILLLIVVDSVAVFQPFVHLPPRSLTAYYQVIKKPVSLTALKKRTKGVHGREKPTGVSDFKTWDAFEDEVSYVWKNAKTFNEDGSDIFNLATEFEEYFNERLALAKQQVEGPQQQPKITLKGRPKPVLHLGAKPSPAPLSTPGVSVDNDALARQKQAVQAGINGNQSTTTPVPHRPSIPPSRSASQIPSATPAKKAQSHQPSSPALTTAPVKAEKPVVPSPALATPRLPSVVPVVPEVKQPSQPTAASMPPPAPRLPSGSPLPAQTVVQTNHVPLYLPAPTTFMDNFSRTKPVADALMPNLTLTTHPQLALSKPFRMDILPAPKFTHQSTTVQLPPTHYSLHVVPTVSPVVLSGRQYKLFVTVNGLRLMATSKPFPLNGDINGATGPRQVYEANLLHGVNRIEVEIVAVNRMTGLLETEKSSIYAHLMRA